MIDSWSFHLSPSPSSSSSTRSSHLSVLTSTSSISSSGSIPSPLPSPASPVGASESRTNAFFASPFSDSTPLPPPNPPKRSPSVKSEASTTSEFSTEDTPKVEQREPPRSLNADFFGPSLLPTPPPSVRSFPNSASGSRDSSSSPPAIRHILHPSHRAAGLFHLDTTNRPHAYHGVTAYGGSLTTSPVDDTADSPGPSTAEVTPVPASHVSTPHLEALPVQPLPAALEPEHTQTVLAPGMTISSSSLTLELVRALGQGAFSSVWLARDTKGQLGALELSRKSSLLRSKSERRGRSRRLEGTRPLRKVERNGKGKKVGLSQEDRTQSDASLFLTAAANSAQDGRERREGKGEGRLVAVKMTERSLCEENERTRVSFVREAEVLRHISHPSIVSYLHSFSTPSHHCLVMEHVGGGELFDLIDSAESHARLTEPLLRRIWGELCKAVARKHSSDRRPLLHPPPTFLPHKTDRFRALAFHRPCPTLLTTLCGSESYAAPELVTGRKYDGRETDAWACGIVLYALATRRLPFDPPRAHVAHHEEAADYEAQHRRRGERKALLVRIAKGEYAWPDEPALARSEGIRRIVGRLLVRDPHKRSKLIDLWEDEWMR
ncbi:CBL-interacting serine/threonine-protein kinase 11 [Grifola frondosa]|uniref:CBL-interacting serine/threonine-protein kinase 11 n=1 Tax=Grifola frondosa TaxID=5627 RepID=A0A1C7MGM8_GRIFR|nr:CBL-interacting serine/threonine-protein kinase 11 [Grifola frondosa]